MSNHRLSFLGWTTGIACNVLTSVATTEMSGGEIQTPVQFAAYGMGGLYGLRLRNEKPDDTPNTIRNESSLVAGAAALGYQALNAFTENSHLLPTGFETPTPRDAAVAVIATAMAAITTRNTIRPQ